MKEKCFLFIWWPEKGEIMDNGRHIYHNFEIENTRIHTHQVRERERDGTKLTWTNPSSSYRSTSHIAITKFVANNIHFHRMAIALVIEHLFCFFFFGVFPLSTADSKQQTRSKQKMSKEKA